MTPQEYVQLKAFARQDGVLLALLLIGGFALYISGLTNPILGVMAMIVILSSPFYAASRLRHFRDYGREGIISFSRSYAYTILLFFYAGVLLAIAVYLYFAFLDKGFLLSKMMEILQSPEGKQAIQTYGLGAQMDENIRFISEMRPIDFALNILTINIISGIMLGIPIAAITQRTIAKSDSLNSQR
ncbi:MAG: DUF4199 domain-containing protein [Prevotella sp.]|jgi:hypothetical protein|nr:DUF4199 domain-containing protein [Prevotella sp.]